MVHVIHIFGLLSCHCIYNLGYLFFGEFFQVESIRFIVFSGCHCQALVVSEGDVAIRIIEDDVFFLFIDHVTVNAVNCRDGHNPVIQHSHFKSLSTEFVILVDKDDVFVLSVLYHTEHEVFVFFFFQHVSLDGGTFDDSHTGFEDVGTLDITPFV